MHLRTKRKVVSGCICGITLCLILLFFVNFCDNTSRLTEEKSSKPQELKEKTYKLATNLLVLVLSAPSHKDVRQVIRETWAKDPPPGSAVQFVIGSKDLPEHLLSALKEENDVTSDILFLVEIEESYTELTRKVLEMLKYADNFIKFNFLLKVDEDSFVRIDQILTELLTKPQERLYWGFFDGRAHVKKSGKWQEEQYVLCDRYIPYALGGGYVISQDLVRFVSQNSDMLQVFKNEDVSLGTWLAPLKIHRVHDPNFDTEYKSRGCYNSYLVTHKKPPDELRTLQNTLDTMGTLCAKEQRVRLSYQYNWSSPPSQCCERKDPAVP